MPFTVWTVDLMVMFKTPEINIIILPTYLTSTLSRNKTYF